MTVAEAPKPIGQPRFQALRAFWELLLFSLGRHWKIRQMGWVSLALLAFLTIFVAIYSRTPNNWRIENRSRWISGMTEDKEPVRMTYREYGEERLTIYQAYPGPPEAFAIKSAVASAYRVMMNDQRYLDDWAFLNYVRWVIFALFLAFLMPLLVLAYATSSMGSERESRTMIWLQTRPIPRWAIYLAKLLGTLPWTVGIALGAFCLLCWAGGDYGRRALVNYWSPVIAGAIAFTALFHLVGAVFRRPSVIGLVYVFFFETLVGSLPGSLKQLSLSYYVRSLFYNETLTEIVAVQPVSIDVYGPADSTTAWLTLVLVSVGLTALGMMLFGRMEAKDET